MEQQRYIFRTERLGFRRYRPDDAEALAAVFGDPYARRFYSEHGRREKLVGWIEWNLRNYEEHGYGLWALELLGDGTFVGDAGLIWQPVEGEWWLEIGYHIHPAQRGCGLATEAALACRDWAFANTDCTQLCSIVHPENVASLKVAGRVHESPRLVRSVAGDRVVFSTLRRQHAC